eukprot:9431891-Alexandrium_andersonii.AAC.1
MCIRDRPRTACTWRQHRFQSLAEPPGSAGSSTAEPPWQPGRQSTSGAVAGARQLASQGARQLQTALCCR